MGVFTLHVRPTDFYFHTLNALPSSLAILDCHGEILEVNATWRQFADANGLTTPRYAVGVNYLHICDLTDSPEAKAAAQGIRHVLAGVATEYVQVYSCHAPHKARWFQLRVARIDEGSAILVVHEDVTERTQAEEQLRENMEFSRGLLESSPDCVKLLNLQGELLWMSEGGQRLMEVEDFEQLRGADWVGFWPDETQEQVRQAINAALQGALGRFQGYSPTTKGIQKFWDVVVTPVRNTEGVPVQLLSTSRDITALRVAQDEILDKASETTRILSNIEEAFFSLDSQWCFTYLNPKAEELLGCPSSVLLSKNVWDMFPEAVETDIYRYYHTARGTQRSGQFEEFYPPLNCWFKVNVTPHPKGLDVFFQNINATKIEEQAQGDRNTILEMTVAGHSLPEILQQTALMVERQLPAHVCAISLLHYDHLSPYAAPSFPAPLHEAIASLKVLEGNGACTAAVLRGEVVVVEDTATNPLCADLRSVLLPNELRACVSLPIINGDRETLGTLALYARTPGPFPPHAFEELEKARHLAAVAIEHHRLAEELAYQARYDQLTGLMNRRTFEQELDQVMSVGHQSEIALLFMDVDDFKSINDHLGHHAGDQILRALAERLRHTTRRGDILARISGDEFTVILPFTSEAEAVVVVQRILDAVAAPFLITEREVYVSVSIGISIMPEGGYDAATLMRSADLAMYDSKRSKAGFTVFRSAMNRREYERFQLAADLRQAIERNELKLHYQPQVQLEDGALVGAEALLRWHHPNLGLVSPAAFIPLAEETGLIVPIGNWVLQTACMQGAAWLHEGRPSIRIAVNVSALQFERADFVEKVAACLAASGFPAERLELELTERVVMRNAEDAVQRMHQLRELGVSLSIDDFGTGYSSLSYLARLPINILKIDHSFIRGLGVALPSYPIVEAILGLANSLRLQTIAEGIETPEEQRVLQEMGCILGQGFLFGRPCPGDELFTHDSMAEQSINNFVTKLFT
ncbi:EAL domain-containing protein [Deinococcus sp. KSM4-11]|uniref:bifunctional diguanylate cyclase/phosphodiesterase n=1 Tax=Deinococcus sp. KSM4-11 TaxID=2568654 RepID=UPI0010A2F461|nr:EAL domain-containing protein [Deinococcus sp. KSM4-11]THF84361.1 EAL domain-containing protein [Deinococcus sp. KSM4-11]